MTCPLIIGPYHPPKTFQRYPSAPAGALLVAHLRRNRFEVILPATEPGLLKALRLGVYYVVRRHSGINEDVHHALTRDIEVEFKFKYSFTLELSNEAQPKPNGRRTAGDVKDASNALKENAIEAVRYYSEHADPVVLFRARLRQKLNELARAHSRPDIGELYDRVLGLKQSGCKDFTETRGMKVCLEQFSVSVQPRGFGTAA